ncbi:hypothetical protein NP233_g10024 [Leucocoprinus birnbaumii]|uniref:Uncharacterized protein n=1 Tax=Leucocoprinus birnbaumii TaxID=56174 RepID=A0AAD5VMR7_9AGAR|nr:hypothetical protein NP233_g10024 [Leucocoprinus birnbaumii]
MLVYRVWAVWNKDKRIGIFLLIFSVVSIGTATSLTIALGTSYVVIASQPPRPCTIVTDIGPWQMASLSFILGYALVLFFLMALQYLRTHREGPYAGTFVREAQLDGLVPYLFVLLVSFCSLLTTILAVPGYGALLLRYQRITHSLVACRDAAIDDNLNQMLGKPPDMYIPIKVAYSLHIGAGGSFDSNCPRRLACTANWRYLASCKSVHVGESLRSHYHFLMADAALAYLLTRAKSVDCGTSSWLKKVKLYDAWRARLNTREGTIP